jgi:putative ABC transport system permease protein
MLKNYFLLAFRTFFKNKITFIINLVGMGIALGCSITAYVNYRYNVDFDRNQENAENLYRIAFFNKTEKGLTPYGVNPIPVANLLRENLHDNDQVIQYISKDTQFRIGDELFKAQFIYTEPAFTRLFTFERLYGSLSLEDKNVLLISDKLAKTYFGTDNVVGKTLTQFVGGEQRDMIVGGVYKQFQPNSSFRFDLITSYDNYFSDPAQRSLAENDWSRWATTFLYLHDPTQAESVERQLKQYVKTQNEARPDLKAESFYVEPFVGMADRAIRQRNQGHWMNMPMPPAAVIAPFAMAGLLLLVACFNFMNNAIAVAGNRLKEIGIRKVIGGRRKELIMQFLAETTLFCIAAMALALVLAEYFTAGWNSMWSGIELSVRYRDNIPFFLVLGGLTLFSALLAGGYPAFYISAFRPIDILRGRQRLGGGGMLSKSLLVLQFSISLAAVIFALAFYYNSKFQKSYDLGYAWRTVIQVPINDPQKYEPLKNKIATSSLIHSIGGSQQHIYASSYSAAGRSEAHVEKEISMLNVGNDYFRTMNVRLVEGREFKEDQASDINESIIVNEEFIRAFSLGDNALGKRMTLNDTTQVYIIGVVKDVYLKALFQPLGPLAFRFAPKDSYRYLVASTDASNLVAANDEIKAAWKQLYPAELYPGRLMEYNMSMALEHFDSVVILYTFLGLVAIIMSVSGLYSLVAMNLQKRTKELGIRKILGASLPHILIQSCKLFLVIMAISFVIGSAMGMMMANGLMNSVWEYYEGVGEKVITLGIGILFLIAAFTVGLKIRSVALSNPVDALRHE